MKKLSLTVIIGVGAMLLLTGCGKETIKCDDEAGKDLVMQIVEEEVKDSLIGSREVLTDDNIPYLSTISTERADKKYKDLDYQLVQIRTESMDDKSQKTECAAKLRDANGKEYGITYSLSITSDDKLYAEVRGL